MAKVAFEDRVLEKLEDIETKIEKVNALIRSLALATGTSEVELKKAAADLGFPIKVMDPGHNEVDPEPAIP